MIHLLMWLCALFIIVVIGYHWARAEQAQRRQRAHHAELAAAATDAIDPTDWGAEFRAQYRALRAQAALEAARSLRR